MSKYIVKNAPTLLYVDKYYYDNNRFKTHLLSALSSLFPAGERMFMKSLTNYIKKYPEFKSDIAIFCKEERNHTDAHIAFNRLVDHAYRTDSLKELEIKTDELLNIVQVLPKPVRVLITEILEHITYSLCETALLTEYQDEFDKVQNDAHILFKYHCEEETGTIHSTIASKIFTKIAEDSEITVIYKLLHKISIYPVLLALSLVIMHHIAYLYKNNKDFKTVDFIKGSYSLFNKRGWIRESINKAIRTW